MNASQSEQAIQESAQNSEQGSIAEANTQLATAASSPTFLGAGLEIGVSGASAYASAHLMQSIYDGAPGSTCGSGAPPPALDFVAVSGGRGRLTLACLQFDYRLSTLENQSCTHSRRRSASSLESWQQCAIGPRTL